MEKETDAPKAENAGKPGAKRASRRDAPILRFRVIFACIAAVAIAIVLLLGIFADRRTEAAIRRAADAALEARFALAFPDRAAPSTGERVFLERGGQAFQFVFFAQGQNQENNPDYGGELIFVVPVTALSGPAASVFYYAPGEGARFVGNCGGRMGGAPSEGAALQAAAISEGNLRKWTSKIEAIAQGIVPAAKEGTASAASHEEGDRW